MWATLLLCLAALRALQLSPWGRVLKAIREDEDAAAALGQERFRLRLQSLGIAAALVTITRFFLAMNVTYLYPSEFDPSFHLLRLRRSDPRRFRELPQSVVVGAVLLCTLTEGLRFLDLPLSAGQAGSLRFIIVGLILICLSMFRPQGLLGNKAEMQLRA